MRHSWGDQLHGVSARSTERGVALGFGGPAALPPVAPAGAARTAEPVRGAPLDGLVVHRGLQRPLLTALDPTSAGRLGIAEVSVPDGLLERSEPPLDDGTLMFCGTFPAIVGIRPAATFRYELIDPVLERTLSGSYEIRLLPLIR